MIGRLAAAACLVAIGVAGLADESPPLRLRRPIAMALLEDGNRLLVACRDSGSVAIVDPIAGRVVQETRIGQRIADLAVTPNGSRIAVVDEAAAELVVATVDGDALKKIARHKVGATPVSVSLSDDGRYASVACLWPRQMHIHRLDAESEPVVLDLPFAPRRQLRLPDSSRLAVADAFGAQVAVIDLARPGVESVRGFEGHNLRGLALSRDRQHLLLAHQVLHREGRPNAGDIRSGSLLANHLRLFSVDTLRDPRVDLLKGERIYNLGDIERGAGDPAALAETGDGLILVCLAGANELLVGRPEQVLWERVPVGNRPMALAVDENRGRAYVANTLDDSITAVDYRAHKAMVTIHLTAGPVELTAAERGERLFHDARLSLDAWFSCQSCHPDGHTNGRLNDNFTDRSFGTPKRVLSLRGVRDSGPWAWNGQMADLETQIRNSVTSTMQGTAPSPPQVADLAAYLRSLDPAPGVTTARANVDAEAFKRGRKIFTREKCATCHSPPTYTTPKTYDVGLRDEAGENHFNPPSLRGVSQGGPYFHDNRGRSLEDVFGRHRHQLAAPLTEQELADLVAFLRTL